MLVGRDRDGLVLECPVGRPLTGQLTERVVLDKRSLQPRRFGDSAASRRSTFVYRAPIERVVGLGPDWRTG